MQACYDRDSQTIILDWQRVETTLDMLKCVLHEFWHHIIDLLKLPEWLHDLIQ